MAMIEVETRSLDGETTALGIAGIFTVVVDRPTSAGGGGLGFSGGQLLYLAVAACVSNDLFREAQTLGINLRRVRVRVHGEFAGDLAVSGDIEYEVDVTGDASEDRLRALVADIDKIAEIPNTLRQGVRVRLLRTTVTTGSS